MATKIAVVLLLLVSTFALKSEGLETAAQNKPGIQRRALTHIGGVDGKAYFYDITAATWAGASDLCQAANMELATIESEAQWTFLITNLPSSTSYSFWTGGITTLSSALGCFGFNVSSSTEHCLVIGNGGRLQIPECTVRWYTLCQI